MPHTYLTLLTLLVTAILGPSAQAQETLLFLPLAKDGKDLSPATRTTATQAYVIPEPMGSPVEAAARFNGIDSQIIVTDPAQLGERPFEISLWVNADNKLDDSAGDLVSQYDPITRTGFHLGIYSHGGVTNGQPNCRQLHFGIDNGHIEKSFTDHGKLGSAVYVMSMCVHQDKLYAATCYAGPIETGHVFRFEGGDRWTDLGSPDDANSVSAMAVYRGDLYVATSKYRLAGSALGESENPNFGGQVYRLVEQAGKVSWENCGRLSEETQAVASLVVFQGKLFASSLYKPAGFFRYDGEQKWSSLPTPKGKRVEAMTVHRGKLYGTSYDEGGVFMFNGTRWEVRGEIPDATQTYAFGIYRDELCVSEWPKAHVYRYDNIHWNDTGKLGDELEAMPLLTYNGKLYAGSLPGANVYRLDGTWSLIGQVDHTPDVRYRRAWSMAVYQGRLFVGTLPSGHVKSIEAGVNVTWDVEFPKGWHHVRARRTRDRLELYVDERLVAQSRQFTEAYNLTTTRPWESASALNSASMAKWPKLE